MLPRWLVLGSRRRRMQFTFVLPLSILFSSFSCSFSCFKTISLNLSFWDGDLLVLKLEKLKLKLSRGRAERDGEKRVRNRTRSLLFSFLSHNLSEFYLVSKHLGISTYCCCSLVKKWDGGGCCQEGVERTRSLRPTVGILSHLRSPAHNSNRLNNLFNSKAKTQATPSKLSLTEAKNKQSLTSTEI